MNSSVAKEYKVRKPKLISCVLLNCFNKDVKGFFHFPKNPDLKSEWLKLCGLESVKSSDRICSKHFDSSSFTCSNPFQDHRTKGVRSRLKSTARPTLILPAVVSIPRF